MRNFSENYAGKTIGNFRIVKVSDHDKRDEKVFHYICLACGKSGTGNPHRITSGQTKSCGCLTGKLISERLKKHGCAIKGNPTPEYRIWAGMKRRCRDSKEQCYKYYGGRGISYCESWEKFENFLADMGKKPSSRHTLGRLDNDGDYEPSNCAWQSRKEQANSTSRNHFETFNGETLTIAQWANKLGVPYGRLQLRLYRGWSFEKAIGPKIRFVQSASSKQ